MSGRAVSRAPPMHISLIMATRNSAAFLPAALSSIAPALGSAANVEIVAADAGSSDETLSILANDPRARIVSYSDSGIYDGMNRAVAAASGAYIMVLNSDDLLEPGTVADAISMLTRAPRFGWISGWARFQRPIGPDVIRVNDVPLSSEGAIFGIPAMNARVFRREMLERLGPIRTDLGLAADREWMLRLARSGERGIEYRAPLYVYRMHEGSSTMAGDPPGRLRVYAAEHRLASAMPTAPGFDAATMRNFRRAGGLAALKLKVAGADRAAWPNMVDAAWGLWRSLTWRGRLAGY